MSTTHPAVAALTISVAAASFVQARTYGTHFIQGTAHVVDGDGISIGGIPDIRLQGIAAPEDNAAKREPGGPESSQNLRVLVEGRPVICHPDGTFTRGRPVAVCYLVLQGGSIGTELGLYQVESGHARDCPRFSKGRYGEAEARARAAGHDLSAIYPLPSYCVRR